MKTYKSAAESPLGEGIKLNSDQIIEHMSFLQGKVLTIVEAAISDKGQLKAAKDLLKDAFSNQMMYVSQQCYPDTLMLTKDQAEVGIYAVDTDKPAKGGFKVGRGTGNY